VDYFYRKVKIKVSNANKKIPNVKSVVRSLSNPFFFISITPLTYDSFHGIRNPVLRKDTTVSELGITPVKVRELIKIIHVVA
jgi:hypothetical protein